MVHGFVSSICRGSLNRIQERNSTTEWGNSPS